MAAVAVLAAAGEWVDRWEEEEVREEAADWCTGSAAMAGVTDAAAVTPVTRLSDSRSSCCWPSPAVDDEDDDEEDEAEEEVEEEDGRSAGGGSLPILTDS